MCPAAGGISPSAPAVLRTEGQEGALNSGAFNSFSIGIREEEEGLGSWAEGMTGISPFSGVGDKDSLGLKAGADAPMVPGIWGIG